MIRFLCLFGVFCGAAIMLTAIILYYRGLVSLRAKSHSRRVFSRWSYGLCMVLMCFFLCGYLVLGTFYAGSARLDDSAPLISAIFFFGAVFVFVVITVQQQMSGEISGKTDEIIRTLVNAMEAKDQYTRGHSVHVSNLVALFYAHLPDRLRHQVDYPSLTDAAIPHDIGKIGISDLILNKPGPLTEEEYAVIRTHPRMGKEILAHTSFAHLGDILLAHHERMDQQGYYRMAEADISIESRMIAIADTFSALYSDRVYRPRRSYAAAMEEIRRVAGTQLDAGLVEVFCTLTEGEINEASRNLFVLEGGGKLERPGGEQALPPKAQESGGECPESGQKMVE